jgi:hypothetical protein
MQQSVVLRWIALIGVPLMLVPLGCTREFRLSSVPMSTANDVGRVAANRFQTPTGHLLALQLDNTTEGGMVVYWNSTSKVLNALAGIQTNTWSIPKALSPSLAAPSRSASGELPSNRRKALAGGGWGGAPSSPRASVYTPGN